MQSRFFVAATLALAACSEASGPTDPNYGQPETQGREACENLDESLCVFPFPSDRYRIVENGKARLDFGDEALPAGSLPEPMSSKYIHSDGFSTITPIYMTLQNATLQGAPSEDHIGDSLNASSRTLIIDTTTGQLVPHWAEFDPFSLDDNKPVIALRLAKRLEYSRRYIVAVHSLVDAQGAAVPATRGFAALRDKKASVVKGIAARRERFEKEVFPAITKLGVDRSKLQLAYDFTTASEEYTTGTLLSMRDQMLAAIGEDGPEYTVDSVESPTDGFIATIVHATAKIPSFIQENPDHIFTIRQDENGKPKMEGTVNVPFDVYIPNSVVNGSTPAPVMQYGHGFLGRKAEASNEWLRKFANERGFVYIASNMMGMSEEEEPLWIQVLGGTPEKAGLLADKAHQGLINHLALVRLMKGRFLKDTDARYTRSGVAYHDPSKIYYFGNSQGGTEGAVMMSIQPDIQRGVLGVPGGYFSLLLTRSIDFAEYSDGIRLVFPDSRELLALLGVMVTGFDRIDSLSYIHRLSENRFPNTTDHRVLLHVGKEDAEVSNAISFVLGRAIGAKLLTPAVRPVWGLEEAATSNQGNTVLEVDFGVPTNPRPNYPPAKNSVHGDLRKNAKAQETMWHFFTTGEVKTFCEGSCDPN